MQLKVACGNREQQNMKHTLSQEKYKTQPGHEYQGYLCDLMIYTVSGSTNKKTDIQSVPQFKVSCESATSFPRS